MDESGNRWRAVPTNDNDLVWKSERMLYHQKVINRSTPIGVQHVCFHRFGMVLTNCEGIRQNPVVTREFA
jgi:hypothetical protein